MSPTSLNVNAAADRHGEVAVVLPGGGVRGAYEAGALAELLPELAARGERVSIFCATSVGAINAAALASLAHLPVVDQVDILIEHWSAGRRGAVLRRILGPRAPLRLARLAGELAGVPHIRAGGLLERSLESWVGWDRLHDNIATGHAHGVCIVATALSDGASVGFLERHRRAGFVRRLIASGRRDAKRWLERHAGFWCADSAHDFDLDPGRATRAAELARLDEWRALRRP